MDTRPLLIIIVIVVGAFVAGRYSAPAKIETVEKTVYIDKIIESKAVESDDVKTVTETVKPDGTKTVKTKTQKKTIESIIRESEKVTAQEKAERIERDSGTLIFAILGGGLMGTSAGSFSGVGVSVPVAGPLEIGAQTNLTNRFEITAGVRF
jgi:hypothetical protein